MTPSLESQYWTYADSNKEINKSFERLSFLRNRINKGERIDRNMLEGFAFKDQKVIWGLEGMYMGQSPKTTMAVALEEITNVEMGLVAAATVGAIMILHKIWTWISKFFNKVFDRTGTASKGDTALSIIDSSDDVSEATAKVTNEVNKAAHEIKAEPNDFDGIDAKYLALATKEGMAAVNNLIQLLITADGQNDKLKSANTKLWLYIGQITHKKTDFGKSLTESPEYQAYMTLRDELNKTKEAYKEQNEVIKNLISNVDKHKKEISAHPGQAFEYLRANEAKIFQLGARQVTKENVEAATATAKKDEDTLNKHKADMEEGGEYLPETTKAMADIIKGMVTLKHDEISAVVNISNLIVDNHNALHHLTTKLLKIVKEKDSDNQTLITTLEEGIKTYNEAKQGLAT